LSVAHFLTWLEASPLGALTRSLGVWSYGVINLVHILGIILLFGSILILAFDYILTEMFFAR